MLGFCVGDDLIHRGAVGILRGGAGGVDGTRMVIALLSAAALAVGLASWLDEAALPLIALAAAALAPASAARLAAADRLRDPTRRAPLGIA